MSDINDEINQQESNDILEVPKFDVADTEDVEKETEVVKQEDENDEFDITNDFRCAELLLDADEDRAAFEIFLDIATSGKEKSKEAVDKLIYILLKNTFNSRLLDGDTWNKIERLSRKGKGYEYAYLLLYFKYSSVGDKKSNETAYKYLKEYFEFFKYDSSGISPVAYLEMGLCLDFGLGIPADEVDVTKAQEYYQMALDGGCVVAYKYIVCSYIFETDCFVGNREIAKEKLIDAIKFFKTKIKNNKAKEIKPFFAELVRCCYFFTDNKISQQMDRKGKKLAQYMIDNNIKGGYRMMGDYFMFSSEDFNLTLAKNYYEEAIKNNDGFAYGQLANVLFIEGSHEKAFKFAHMGCSRNHSYSYATLGRMYEEKGKKYDKNNSNAKRCYFDAWYYYEKAFYKFGLSPENLGRLYLDYGVLPNGYKLEELERVLEIGSKQLRGESVLCYLRLILRNNGIDESVINYKIANKLPPDDRKKYIYYLEKGAYTGRVEFIEEYIKSKPIDDKTKEKLYGNLLELTHYLSGKQIASVYKYADENTKTKVTQIITGQPFADSEQIVPVYQYADDINKAKVTIYILKQRFIFSDIIRSIYVYADKEAKAKLTNKLLKKDWFGRDELESIYNYSDDNTKAKLNNKLLRKAYLDRDELEIIYNYSDDNTKAKLNNKLLRKAYLGRDKLEIIYNYSDDNTKAKLNNKLLKNAYLLNRDEMVSIYNNSDEKTKAKLFRKIIEEAASMTITSGDADEINIALQTISCNDERIEFIYEYANEKNKAKLSKKLVMNSYIASSKKLFLNIVNNYKGRWDDSVMLLFIKTVSNLFVNENKDEYLKFINSIKDGIEKTEDENLKKLWRTWRSNFDAAIWQVIEKKYDESIKEFLVSYRKDTGFTDWEAIIQSLSEFEKSEDEDTREKYVAVRKCILDDMIEIVWKNPMDEVLVAINDSKDEELKNIYENYSRKYEEFMDPLLNEIK